MNDIGKQISNSASTGGLGIHFENRVQASFVVLMLTGGFAPCLTTWPIVKIKLQGKYQGFETDDLIVYTKQPGSDRQAKLLGQIKHSIAITKSSKIFGEVIQSAWSDFNNKQIFSEGMDAITLICGPLSATDTDDVRSLLSQAKYSDSAEDFLTRVERGNFTSNEQREKLEVFKVHLKTANKNIDLTNDQLWRFLKSFHLLIYDLDIKGVTLSLLHTLIVQHSRTSADALWTQIKDHVEWESENAGCITVNSIAEEIRSVFKRITAEVIPLDFVKKTLEVVNQDWNRHPFAHELAIVSMLGSWSEKSSADRGIISHLAREEFVTWIPKLREVLQQPESPVNLKNGIWSVKDRKNLWQSLGTRIFDENLDLLKQCVVTVLTERDPKFDLPKEERFAAGIHGKFLKYSHNLRNGLAESLALLDCYSSALTNCSLNKAETSTVLAVREIFDIADWILWGSLNDLLPLLAESAPDEFLKAIESALQQTPCPFDVLFAQEGNAITGGNYLTGLLWALETLAWEEQFLVRVSVILGELACHDPGGNWANRPSNSLSTIFLPWLPQTMATVEKRKVALQTLGKEAPEVAWKLLVDLLPNQHQMSMGSHKPVWRNTIPEGFAEKVSNKEYWEQVIFYADLAVEMARDDTAKLNQLISHLDNLPEPSFDKVLVYLSSEAIITKPESLRLGLWTGLTEFASKHKRFADAEWALSPDIISKIEEIARALSPKNLLNLHSRIFNGRDYDLYDDNGDWQVQERQLEERRQQAIKGILDYGGIDAVFHFVDMVESPSSVGHSLGFIAEKSIDSILLPMLLETDNKKLEQFVS